MKRKFAFLYIVAALAALAIPTSSMGAIYPAGHKFEITGSGNQIPEVETSLGECQITKITGTIPTTGNAGGNFQIPAPTVGSCSTGASLTLSGEWRFGNPTGSFIASATTSGAGNITMRFSSLPGCKLANTSAATGLLGLWSNGTTTPSLMKSGYHADYGFHLTWANDGGTCALAGTEEFVNYVNQLSGAGIISPTLATVTDTTSPSTPITFGP